MRGHHMDFSNSDYAVRVAVGLGEIRHTIPGRI